MLIKSCFLMLAASKMTPCMKISPCFSLLTIKNYFLDLNFALNPKKNLEIIFQKVN